ncbi:MAG: class I SAM-dependent methyltransferase, partial [Cytophagaceae bacterium]
MIFNRLKFGYQISDLEFDRVFPVGIQRLSERHWTPVQIAQKAAKLLVKDENSKVLDIGSGVGKFCLIGAATTGAKFIGIEQRKSLVDITRSIIRDYKLPRIEIFNSNIRSFNFKQYDAFYFFNPFYENLEPSSRIDSKIPLSITLYKSYYFFVKKLLEGRPLGSKVVTYYGFNSQIPISY